jgi:hypothetical protein
MKYLLAVILLSSLTSNASAQITITEADYINFETVQANGTVDTALNASVLLPIIGQSGPNQTWDFTKALFNSDKGRLKNVFVPYSDAILGATDSNFLSATYVEESPASTVNGFVLLPTNEFYKITSSGAWDLGGCDDSDGAAGNLLSLNPPVEVLPFPLTSQTNWQSTSKQIGPEVSIYNASITQIEVVDGYGTLILPNHSENALRVKETLITKDSVQGFEFADTGDVYIFYTLDGYQARIAASSIDTFASYTVPNSNAVNPQPVAFSGLNMSLTQNPVISGNTTLLFSLPDASPVQIELMDLLGRNIRMLEHGFEAAGVHSLPIDAKTLSAGTYFVRLQTGSVSAMQKLVIQ